MLSITPTKLSDYLTCPHKFKLKHVEKQSSFASSAAFSFGTSMHRALQELHNPNGLSSDVIDAKQLLGRFWQQSAYQTREEEKAYFVKGCQALENYCETTLERAGRTLGTEVYMSFIVSPKDIKIRLGCKVDRIALCPDETLEIIDYKTNASGAVPTSGFVAGDLPTFFLSCADENQLSAVSAGNNYLSQCFNDGESFCFLHSKPSGCQ